MMAMKSPQSNAVNERVSKLFEFYVPELPVKDVPKTLDYYRDVLGFKTEWIWDTTYGHASNGVINLYFIQSEFIHPVCCYLHVNHVEEIYSIYKDTGAKIVKELELKPWGMKEFRIEDINGHHFRIGQGSEEGKERARFTSYDTECTSSS